MTTMVAPPFFFGGLQGADQKCQLLIVDGAGFVSLARDYSGVFEDVAIEADDGDEGRVEGEINSGLRSWRCESGRRIPAFSPAPG